jgi:hypothetical protein
MLKNPPEFSRSRGGALRISFWLVITASLAAHAMFGQTLTTPPSAAPAASNQVPSANQVPIPGAELAAPVISPISEALVPAALGVRTDAAGNAWNVELNGTIGRVGSAMVNSGLTLLIDGQRFVPREALMTKDGSEFVLPGLGLDALPGLQIQRRIRLVDSPGGMRYAEVFYNSGSESLVITVDLETNFSGNFKTFVSDRGRSEPVLLGDGESGILVLPGSAPSSRAFLFTLAGSKSALKASISAPNRYALSFRHRLELASGETAVLLHHVAQVPIPQRLDRRALLPLFRPFELSGLVDSTWQQHVVNLPGRKDEPEPEESVHQLVGSSLGVEPGSRDVLVSGQRSHVYGKVSGGNLLVKSLYGETEVPLDEVAAVEGNAHLNGPGARVFLRDGQIIAGDLDLSAWSFAPTEGSAVLLQANSLDRLILARSESDAPKGGAWVETFAGDRLLLPTPGDLRFEVATPWGTCSVTGAELIELEMIEGDPLGRRMRLRNGTDCFVAIKTKELRLQSERFGEVLVPVSEIAAISPAERPAEPLSSGSDGGEARVRLVDGGVVIGRMEATTLTLLTSPQATEIELHAIKSLEKTTAESVSEGGLPLGMPTFRVEQWDRGVSEGILKQAVLDLSVAGEPWRIPLADIERIVLPASRPDRETLITIARLVTELGHEQWAIREQATRELQSFGFLAAGTLREERNQSKDPEVIRRIDRVLGQLDLAL